jgi:hypothetical protein
LLPVVLDKLHLNTEGSASFPWLGKSLRELYPWKETSAALEIIFCLDIIMNGELFHSPWKEKGKKN